MLLTDKSVAWRVYKRELGAKATKSMNRSKHKEKKKKKTEIAALRW